MITSEQVPSALHVPGKQTELHQQGRVSALTWRQYLGEHLVPILAQKTTSFTVLIW